MRSLSATLSLRYVNRDFRDRFITSIKIILNLQNPFSKGIALCIIYVFNIEIAELLTRKI